jgi:pyroglutamyl-peptidase
LLRVCAQELAEALPAALAAGKCGPLPAGAALASPCVVLTTAGRTATAQLAALPLPTPLVAAPTATPPAAAAAASAAAAAVVVTALDPQPVVCVVHLGVHSCATCFHLERCAWNDASFRCPDEAGWQPHGEAVVSADPLGSCRATHLPVDALVEELRAEGHACQASDDPGRCVVERVLAC